MRPTGNQVIAYLLVALIGAASVFFFFAVVVPPIRFLISTVTKAVSLALTGA